jgi:hypothetical protein
VQRFDYYIENQIAAFLLNTVDKKEPEEKIINKHKYLKIRFLTRNCIFQMNFLYLR